MPVLTDFVDGLHAAPRHRSGRYYAPIGGQGTTVITSQNESRPHPFWVPEAGVYDRIGIELTVLGEAGSVVRLGIYASDGEFGEPSGQPILDAGVTAADAATGFREITISQALPPGLVYLVGVNQICPTTPPTVRATAGPSSNLPAYSQVLASLVSSLGIFRHTGVTGALPAWAGAYTGSTGTVPRVFLRKA